jgi:hypothetical protein
MHLSIESLAPALKVSRYCRQVILGSLELRRVMFLEPAPIMKHLEPQREYHEDHTLTSLDIVDEPSENSFLIVKPHPALVKIADMYDNNRTSTCGYPDGPSHGIADRTMETMQPNVLLFQPRPSNVTIHYRGQQIAMDREKDFTFGAVTEKLRRAHEESQIIVNKVVKRRPTYANRKVYAAAIEVLGSQRLRHYCWHYRRCEFPLDLGVFLVAHDAITDDDRGIELARKGLPYEERYHRWRY